MTTFRRPLPHAVPGFPSRVYLTGPMASGKSTVGPLLADALGLRFVDLDWLVEARTGQRVADLFASEGERAFRSAEADALGETTRGEPTVVATGGGTLAVPTNLRAAQAAGAVVWLRATPETLDARLASTDLTSRPLLLAPEGRPLAGPARLTRIRALLDAREPFYAQADVVVEADGAPEAVALDAAEALRRWQGA